MRAIRCTNGHPKVVEIPAPTGEGIRVRIAAAGICGSDLHLLDAGFSGEHTLGHEFAGITSDGVAVAVEPLVPCGQCPRCEEGAYNLCTSGGGMILGIAQDGGMAEEIVVPDRCLVPLPSGLDLANASLVEPVAVAVHGVHRAEIRASDSVAVVGGGTIGLCAVAAARSTGARVDLLARHDHQKAAGERLGAGEVSDDYDVVLDSAGTKSALESASQLVRPGGRLGLLATYWEGMDMPAFAVCMKEVTIFPASLYAESKGEREFDSAAALLAENGEIATTLITHRFPLEAASEAFRTARDRASGAIKVILEP